MSWKNRVSRFFTRLKTWWFRITVIIASLFTLAFLVWSALSGWKVQNSDTRICGATGLDGPIGSYVQLGLFDQEPNEPVFNGNMFAILGPAKPSFPIVQMRISPEPGKNRGYYDTVVPLTFGQVSLPATSPDYETQTMMREPLKIAFSRTTGSHRDFPFDSGRIALLLSFEPKIKFERLTVRNYNASFFIPCDTFSVKQNGAASVLVKFEIRRNPLVRLTALVLLFAATSFVFIIAFRANWDSLPTSMASFFFSLWSIRSILSLEIKTFPTKFDLSILFLSVLLLVLVAIRAAWRLTRKESPSTLSP